MSEVKNLGRYLYQYDYEKNTVSVARITVFSDLASRFLVNEMMAEVTEHTGYYRDMEYEGHIYVGSIFDAIPENKLREVLAG